jgi:hypothetical protein
MNNTNPVIPPPPPTHAISKDFIHHFHRTTKATTENWHPISTSPGTSTHSINIYTSSEQPTTVIPPSPLPSLRQTSYLDVTTHLPTNRTEASISCFICNDTVCGDQDFLTSQTNKKSNSFALKANFSGVPDNQSLVF